MSDDSLPSKNDRGLYPKYEAIKINTMAYELAHNLTDPDAQHIKIGGFPQVRVQEPFFLIKFDDPFAPDALRAYARACEAKYPILAEELRTKIRETTILRMPKEN